MEATMKRTVGTVVRGVRTPVISEGDNLVEIVVNSLLECSNEQKFDFHDRDVVAVTEAVVARAQGNYATIDNIAKDVRAKFGTDELGLVFPILSRNRFAVCLKGIAKAVKKIYLQLSYPADEVGNHLFCAEKLFETGLNPYADVLDITRYRELFGYELHPFTGIDYIEYYTQIVKEQGCEIEIIFSNNPISILDYTKNVLTCDIHSRHMTKKMLQKNGVDKIYNLSEILTSSIDGSGYNEQYGLLGSNKATEEKVKLFPRDCHNFVFELQKRLLEKTNKHIEVLVYGDGAFKDPVGKIWELADPVVSPAYTPGLEGTPNEFKLKFLADNDFANLKGEALEKAIREYIANKKEDSIDSDASQGTTPRQLSDLLGSLADLTSGSGDKGTPVVLIQGYFDNFSS
jgi:hypothetical protein